MTNTPAEVSPTIDPVERAVGAEDASKPGDVVGSVRDERGAVGPMDDYDDMDDECANCGGEGYVSNCFQEFACKYPDEGCEDCMRRCDWCSPRQVRPSDPFETPTPASQESTAPTSTPASQSSSAVKALT